MNPILALAVGLAGGILIGRQLVQCQAAASHATKTDVVNNALSLAGRGLHFFEEKK